MSIPCTWHLACPAGHAGSCRGSSGAFAGRVVDLHTGQWFTGDGEKVTWSSALLPLTWSREGETIFSHAFSCGT